MLRRLIIVIGIILVGVSASACTPASMLAPNSSLPLTSFTENNVEVSVALVRDTQGTIFLTATFTPPPHYYMYSKELPRHGVDGLGRPTLLELTDNSRMTGLGLLIESVSAVNEIFADISLPVYPSGPVTLSLPVSLPPGADWVEDEISLTFMACSAQGCKPPVVQKIIPVRVPGADSISNP